MDSIINSTFFIPSETSSNIKYGRLYNWPAALDAKFAPSGWHVPTQEEWTQLIGYLGGETVAGGKMKEIGTAYWNNPNTGATNESGLNMRGGGTRNGNGTFLDLKVNTYYRLTQLLIFSVSYDNNINEYGGVTASRATSVRLIKDNPTWAEGDTLTDYDGNVYRTVKIGNQVWLADNWACTSLNDGTPIPNVTDNTEWSELATGAYCNYDNDIENVFIEVPT